MKRLILSLVIRKLVTLLGKGFVRSSTVRCNLSLCVFATFCFQKFQVEAQSISTCHCIKDIYIYIFCFEYVGSTTCASQNVFHTSRFFWSESKHLLEPKDLNAFDYAHFQEKTHTIQKIKKAVLLTLKYVFEVEICLCSGCCYPCFIPENSRHNKHSLCMYM